MKNNNLYKLYLRIFACSFVFLSSCTADEVYLYDKSDFLPNRQISDPYRGNNYQQRQYNNIGGFTPNSRSYNNPYEIRQQGYYPYYDTDRYYVPPSYYRNVEPTYNSGGANTKY